MLQLSWSDADALRECKGRWNLNGWRGSESEGGGRGVGVGSLLHRSGVVAPVVVSRGLLQSVPVAELLVPVPVPSVVVAVVASSPSSAAGPE